MENKELVSNEYYSLSELFSTLNRKIIIPDFQRDYCWGDKTHGEEEDTNIVDGFLETLVEEFKSNKEGDVLLGKIDVYEHPKNHIYLTDGQQRLTTLYLIIGMLYKKVQNEGLKNCLISEDKETYLQYAIRESTVFFLLDLVSEFFIKENSLKVSDIKEQPWYFSEYDLDPTIVNMLSALGIIEERFKGEEKKNVIGEFSNFVISKIKIQYYDVQDKKHGEERFVIINTTGKSLTVSENIKPILLGSIENSDFAKQWEERETWFWKNRNKEKEIIADNGVNDFLTWCFQILDKPDEVGVIKKAKELLKNKDGNNTYLEKIHKHFKSLKQLIEHLEDDKFQNQFKFINDNKEVKGILGLRALSKAQQQNVLFPLLAFISEISTEEKEVYQFLRRLRKNYFDQKWDDRKANYVGWCYVLQIIEKSQTLAEVLTFDTLRENAIKVILKVDLHQWYNEEEKRKLQLSEHKHLLERWEDHMDFMGDLSPLLNVVQNRFDISELQSYYDMYEKLDINSFTYSDDIRIKNIYRLISYLNNGDFENRSVQGWGYCMLKKSNKHLFLHKDFIESLWTMFNRDNIDSIYDKLKIILKNIINEILDKNTLVDIIENTKLLRHCQRVKLWAIIEFLNTDQELYFDKSICQFWEYPNLIKIEQEMDKNNYKIGNLLLGTSYTNNKTGWIHFIHYPLMKKLSEKRDNYSLEEIEMRTSEIKKLLSSFLN